MYRADLHIHSRFSRATSKKLTLRNLAAWASLKGIHVLGTGDFTHPKWREELKNGLVFDEESALYRLRDSLTCAEIEQETGHYVEQVHTPLFILQAEISSIYKKHDKVRKVHNLIFAPSIEEADSLSKKLEKIGNLHSDGRPILGLDCQDLLDMVLQQQSYLVPAHIWTPWFSLFGSKSGFDSLVECFGDLTSEIFAVETGLSSDPNMNRCWSHLDHLSLISNSDAHSGENLAREVNLFDGAISYKNIFSGLKKQNNNFLGTIEFFPEEGKYHLDGHRNCSIVFEPSQSLAENNICPVCQKPLTIGVLNRVLSLAGRKEPLVQVEPLEQAEAVKSPEAPKSKQNYVSIIPLAEIVGELVNCGPKSKKVRTRWGELIRRFGSELDLLTVVDVVEIRSYWAELGEAISRMRAGNVICHAGYDGEFGTIRLFSPQKGKDNLKRAKVI